LASSLHSGTRFPNSSFDASPASTSCILPICPGDQSIQTSRILRWLLLIMGIRRDHSCPLWRLFSKAYKNSRALSPVRAASHGTTSIRLPSTSKSSALGSPGLCSAAGLPHCPLNLGPHYFMAMTARADTDDHIPEQLSLAGQDQVQVTITLLSPAGSSAKKLSQGTGYWHSVTLPGQ